VFVYRTGGGCVSIRTAQCSPTRSIAEPVKSNSQNICCSGSRSSGNTCSEQGKMQAAADDSSRSITEVQMVESNCTPQNTEHNGHGQIQSTRQFCSSHGSIGEQQCSQRNNLLRHHVDQTSMPLASCRGVMRTTNENKTAQNGRTSQPCTFRCHRSHTAFTGWWLSDRDHCSCGCCVDLWLACMCPNILSAIDVRPACPSMHQQ
jgi:hypothetical protein